MYIKPVLTHFTQDYLSPTIIGKNEEKEKNFISICDCETQNLCRG